MMFCLKMGVLLLVCSSSMEKIPSSWSKSTKAGKVKARDFEYVICSTYPTVLWEHLGDGLDVLTVLQGIKKAKEYFN